ncbi:MAG TPA: type II toxin-antitoxin system Phd/YefM family antitoxin [Cryptosporangiaceae bacterium]|nr:type II toxin-antitoxin system Phd/YefM family antitoxin [Cryptosporangiaceae bacterium]
MTEVGVHEAKTHLSKLLVRAESGEEIVITRGGEPVARLTPVRRRRPRPLGAWAGQMEIPDDFDETPDWLIAEFEK